MIDTTEARLRGDWMQTHSGKRFYPESPRAEDIYPEDIAHALSMLCRYGGHIDRFYSVAEHCVLVSEGVSEKNAIYGLLHDATEAYVVDVPRPVKRILGNYNELEKKVWFTICERFGIDPEVPAEIIEADTRILLTERERLFKNAEVGAWSMDGMEPLPVNIVAFPAGSIFLQQIYLKKLNELLGS